ncbi:MAG: hypothetical protein IJ053_06855 [Lachnospiraceae bacterium]|nr:hypothetical protein [Lachnospiraceae bacterium]
MEIILGFYLSKQVDLEVGYKILLMFFLPIIFIVIDIKIYFKNTSVFKNSKYYNKRNGVFLDYKIVLVPMYKGGTKEIYYVVVGTFNDNNEPIVAQIEVAYNVFNNIKNNLEWNIVMYNDKIAGIV